MVSKKVISGFLAFIILSTAFYVYGPGVRIRVDDDKAVLYTSPEGSLRWMIVATAYDKMFDGTSRMNRRVSGITRELFVDNETNLSKIVRTTPYIRGPVIIHTWYFDGNKNRKEDIPISETIEIINGSDYIYQYEVRDLDYSGDTMYATELAEQQDNPYKIFFGKDTKIEWDDRAYWDKVYKSGIFKARYRPETDYEIYYIRLLDPTQISACGEYTASDTDYYLGGDVSGDHSSLYCVGFVGVDNFELDGNSHTITCTSSDEALNIDATSNHGELFDTTFKGVDSANVDGHNLSFHDCTFEVYDSGGGGGNDALQIKGKSGNYTNIIINGKACSGYSNICSNALYLIAGADNNRIINVTVDTDTTEEFESCIYLTSDYNYIENVYCDIYRYEQEVIYTTGADYNVIKGITPHPHSKDDAVADIRGTHNNISDIIFEGEAASGSDILSTTSGSYNNWDNITVQGTTNSQCVDLQETHSVLTNFTVTCNANGGNEVLDFTGADTILDTWAVSATPAADQSTLSFGSGGTNVTVRNFKFTESHESTAPSTIEFYGANSNIYDNNFTFTTDTTFAFALKGSNIALYNNYIYTKENEWIMNGSYSTIVNNWNTSKQTGTRITGNGSQIGGNAWFNSSGSYYSSCTDANTDGFCDDTFSFGYNTSDYIGNDYLPLSDEYTSRPIITLDSPSTGETLFGAIVTFNFSVTSDNGIANGSLYGNFSGSYLLNQTNSTGITDGVIYNFNTVTLGAGDYIWNVYVCDNSDICDWGENNFTLKVNDSRVVVNLVSPSDNAYSGNLQTFNCSITDDVLISNLTLYVWNSTDSNIYTNTTDLTGTSNQTSWVYNLTDDGVYKWNCLGYNSDGTSDWAENYTLTVETVVPQVLLDGIYANRTYEYGTTANISAVSSGDVCFDVYLPNYGLNYTCTYPFNLPLYDFGSYCNTSTGLYSTLNFNSTNSTIFYANLPTYLTLQSAIATLNGIAIVSTYPKNVKVDIGSEDVIDVKTDVSDIKAIQSLIGDSGVISKYTDDSTSKTYSINTSVRNSTLFYIDLPKRFDTTSFAITLTPTPYQGTFTENFVSDTYINDTSTTAIKNSNWNYYTQPISGSTYTTGIVNSTIVETTSTDIDKATLTATSYLLSGTEINYYMSANGGTNWESVNSSLEHTFANTGTQLMWTAILSSTGTDTAYLMNLSIDGYGSSPRNVTIDINNDGADYVGTTELVATTYIEFSLSNFTSFKDNCADPFCELPLNISFIGKGDISTAFSYTFSTVATDLNVNPINAYINNWKLPKTTVYQFNDSTANKSITSLLNTTTYIDIIKNMVINNFTLNITGDYYG